MCCVLRTWCGTFQCVAFEHALNRQIADAWMFLEVLARLEFVAEGAGEVSNILA
jgi:hypothetical protein